MIEGEEGAVEFRSRTVRILNWAKLVAVGSFDDTYLQIDTRPDTLTVLDHAAANRWSDIESGSGMWPVPPGPITVEVTAAGATSATRIVLSLEPLYETA